MDFWSTWGNTLAVVGRLKPGVTAAQAQDEADRLFPHLKLQHKDWYLRLRLRPHHPQRSRCGQVAALAGRSLVRRRPNSADRLRQPFEPSAKPRCHAQQRVRHAPRTGCKPRATHPPTPHGESHPVSSSVLSAGLAIASAIIYYLAHQNSIALPLLTTRSSRRGVGFLDPGHRYRVGILFGLAPALRISGTHIQEAIKDNAAGMAAGRSHERFRSVLVISEVALACLLLVGAGLLLRSFLRVLNVDLGFNPSHAAAMQIDLPAATNKDQLDSARHDSQIRNRSRQRASRR